MRNNQPVTGHEAPLATGQTLVSVTDLKGRIVYCNPSFASVSGFTRDELLGQPHNLVRHPDMPAEAFRDMWATLQSGRPWTATVKNRRKNGDHYWVRANACPMKDGARIVGFLSVRTAPSREEVQQAETLYARMRQEAAASVLRTGLQRSHVVRVDPLGRMLQAVLALPARLGLPGTLTLGLVLATGAAATWLGPALWLPLALAGFVVVHIAVQRLRRAPLRDLLEDVVHLASGDLTHPVQISHGGMVGEMQLALAQLSVNLRTVISDARTEIENLRGSAAEIAAGNRDLSARTESQAASLEQTAASMEQINSTVRQSAASAMQGSRLAAETASIAQRSHDGVLGVVQAMGGIAESSQRIAQITHVIEGVAFQTNILALNAAVEAARAGDAGRGFAVVAGEVRMLARRTTEAAREITQLIQESGERVAAGDAHTQAARQRMHEALQSVGNVTALLEQISTAAVEQQTGVAQVNQAVADLDAITQQNAAMVEQLSAGADTLDAQVVAVTGSMRIFRLHAGEATVAELDAVALRRQAKADAGIDLADAIARHQQWKTNLRNAALRGEKLEAERIVRDDCCQLGQWLHGSGRGQWSNRPVFTDLLDKHAGFHREAGRVAAAVNAGHKDEALRMLANATAFSRAGQATVMAIRALQAEAKRPQPQMGAPSPPAPARREATALQGEPATPATASEAEGAWASF